MTLAKSTALAFAAAGFALMAVSACSSDPTVATAPSAPAAASNASAAAAADPPAPAPPGPFDQNGHATPLAGSPGNPAAGVNAPIGPPAN